MTQRSHHHLTVAVLLILLTAPLSTRAQNAAKVQEPEYKNVFFALSTTDASLLPLERQTGTLQEKVGFGGGESFAEIKGERSPIRFKADQQLSFVVRLDSPETDPGSAVQFFSWQPKKNGRKLVISKAGVMGTSGTTGFARIPFDAGRYGESSAKVTPTKPLAPGEYGLGSPLGNPNLFSFGIDPPDEKSESKPK